VGMFYGFTDPLDVARRIARSDPAGVLHLAAQVDEVARSVGEEAARLRTIASDARGIWDGEAAESFTAAHADLPGWLDRVYWHFAGVSFALHRVAQCQEELRVRARSVVRNLEAAASAARAAGHPFDPDADMEAIRRADAHVRRWRAECEQLAYEWDAVARAQARAMYGAAEDLDDPTGWGALGRRANVVFRSVTSAIASLDELQPLLDAVALASVVAMAVPPAVPFAMGAYVASTSVNLAIDTAQAVEGDGSWVAAGFGAVELATLGASRSATMPARTARIVDKIDTYAGGAEAVYEYSKWQRGEASPIEALAAVGSAAVGVPRAGGTPGRVMLVPPLPLPARGREGFRGTYERIVARGDDGTLPAARKLADRYGGRPGDWVQVQAGAFRGDHELTAIGTWFENVGTGQRVELRALECAS